MATVTKSKNNTDTPENHLHETEARWFAIHTGFRKEKQVDKQLKKKGIETYLPLQKVTRRYTRKVREAELPLFSCYLFVKIKKSEYIKVLQTEHVFQFVHFKRNLLAIPESEIDVVRRILGEELAVQLAGESYQKGDKVEVIGGQLTGLEGTLVEVDGLKKLVVELENVGFGLEVEVDVKYLRKAR